MKILDIKGNEITNPDLEKGYLKIETLVIKHHAAVAETPAEYKTVQIADGLFEKQLVKPWQPGKGAWDETETIERYIEYTAEELAEKKRQEELEKEEQKKAEEQARIEAEKQAIIASLPEKVNDIEEGIAEIGVIAADNATTLEDAMEALAELGTIVAELAEK